VKSSAQSDPRLPPKSAFAEFRFPPEVIVVAVRWYLRFNLSYHDIEELLVERGVEVDHVTVFEPRLEKFYFAQLRPTPTAARQFVSAKASQATNLIIVGGGYDAGLHPEATFGSAGRRVGDVVPAHP
jgi:hypothetical protein